MTTRTPLELLAHLRHLGVKVWSEGQRLRYSAPQNLLSPALRSELVAQKGAILELLHSAYSPSEISPLLPTACIGVAPVSFAQQRLWFLDRLQSGNPAYNIPFALRLSGPLDIVVIQRSLNEIVGRHETLRTTFALHDGQPVQMIAPVLTVPLPLIDLRDCLTPDRDAEVQRVAREDAQRPFDLERGPLLRTCLLRLDEHEHVLVLTIHHIVADGWSFEVLLRELVVLYAAFSGSKPGQCNVLPLPDLPVQYRDFTKWQRQILQGAILERQLAYWRTQLAGDLPMIQLPTDYPRPTIATFRGATITNILPPALVKQLVNLSQREGMTLFMVLLAAFKALLFRYNGQTDIVVGTPIANRNRSEIEKLIGFFVNMLVLRTDLDGNPTFRELLNRVRTITLDAYAHQDTPFEEIVRVIQPKRDLSYQPLFQVMFVVQNTPSAPTNTAGLTLTPLAVENETSKFDLSLLAEETPHGLATTFEYSTDLFDSSTISRMAGHWQTLLEAAALNPDQRLCDLPLLTDAEQEQFLVVWNSTQTDYAGNASIHELFEAQAERTPNAIALVFEEQQLTYRELNRRSNQLAHYLRGLGIGPDVLIALCMERSLELVVGLLGILKAGGAYVPIDPDYPCQRIAYLLADVQAAVLLTQRHLVDRLPQNQAKMICLDSAAYKFVSVPDDNPQRTVNGENLAYVIYTSGSTGTPKGSMIPHLSIRNRLLWMQEQYQLTPNDRVLQKTPFNFDVSVWEFFWPLIVGARLVLARPGGHRDNIYLMDVVKREQITTIHFVPSMLAAFLEQANVETCSSLQRVICSGEALSFDLQEQFFARLPAELHNLYGPTEASIDVTAWACVHKSGRALVPIGRPIANTHIYILDAQLHPRPIGLPGELYIGGSGLARGYLNRADLTAERFVPNPFLKIEDRGLKIEDSNLVAQEKQSSILNPQSSTRLYRTGDLARYLPDGAIEYLGRLDHQIKIRGFRIEPGEIEAQLKQHPSVQQAVVIAREDRPGDRRLVAYIAPTAEDRRLRREDGDCYASIARSSIVDPPSSIQHELRHFLKEKLPEYMLPSTFIVLEALPISPNGKLDRSALPAPSTVNGARHRRYIAPRDVIELRLAQLWEELLQRHPISVTDNFFDLGGHSLLAVRMLALFQERFGQRIRLPTLFQEATIAYMAENLRRQSKSLAIDRLVPLQIGKGELPFFCVHPAGGHVFCYRELSRCLGAQQPFYGLQSLGLEGDELPHRCIKEMAGTYIQSLRTIQPDGPYLLGGWSMGGVVAFEMACQLRSQGQTVALLALFDSLAPTAANKRELVKDNAQLLADFQRDLRVLNAPVIPDRPGGADMTQIETRWFEIYKANIWAQRLYEPAPYPGRITLFRAEAERAAEHYEAALSWSTLSLRPVEIVVVQGDHYTMLALPNVEGLAEQLRARIEQAQQRLADREWRNR